jgi:acyl-CoA reductase-like NAD-dependent aldehyde dehydrogenase
MERLKVLKTYKIYIGGAFPRTESGRYYTPVNATGEKLANMCWCSKKDVKNAIVAARKAYPSWNGKLAFNRSQILYRIAEMLESRSAQFVEELCLQGVSLETAKKEVELACDRIVYYAGWCDKISQVTGSVNSVASSHLNFSTLESLGVVTIIADQATSLIGLVSQVIPVITSGNTCVVAASEQLPLCAITFAEVIHSSDVPGGVVNILTGKPEELAEVMANHMDVNAFYLGAQLQNANEVKQSTSLNVKTVVERIQDWTNEQAQSLHQITAFMAVKTTWHQIETGGGVGTIY